VTPQSIDELLAALWADYTRSTPQAARIHALLAARGETVRNDHVALRTFDNVSVGVGGIGIAALAAPFEALGWQPRDRYDLRDKHLRAAYWQHPDPALPKVFISELRVGELPAAVQRIIGALVAQLPPGFAARADLPWAGRPWTVSFADYDALRAVSEYAAWVAAFGFRVNHFTVDVNALVTFADLPALIAALTAAGFALNTAGGVIKGSPVEHLEQAATLADTCTVELADRSVTIPSCYYEFARRYPLPSGELFHGFIPESANRIFESTDVR
jgi:2-oxoadipate dioxygenase/decarboxylase-like protein